MNHLEKVEKLRQRADVSYEEAKEALESCDWDILDALILLESQGKVKAPASGEAAGTSVSSEHRGHFGESDASASGEQAQEEPTHALAVCETKEEENKKGQSGFFAKLGRAIQYLVAKGCENSLVIKRHGQVQFELPVIAFIILLILFFWVVVPLMFVSLFFDFSYNFKGAELGKESINRTMDQATEAVNNFRSEINKEDKN